MASFFVTQVRGVQVVEVSGRLDGDSSPRLGRQLDDLIEQGHSALVLDMGNVEYISSPGLREIVRIYKIVQTQDGDLRIANPSDRVMDVFELAGLDTTLRIFQTRNQAVESF